MMAAAQPLRGTADMIRTLVLIACLAGAAHGSLSWNTPNLTVKFDYTITGLGKDAFIEMPLYKDDATSQGWTECTGPTRPEGLEALALYCYGTNYTLCLFYDDTDYIAGLQIGIEKTNVEEAAFDFTEQGFVPWDFTLEDGTSSSYWTVWQFYLSADDLATSADTRIANRDSTKLLQFDNIWVSGFDGVLYNISTNTDYVTGADSIYTEQACIPWMGHHYYYNMTTELECTSKQVFNWFPLIYSNQLIGVGFMGFMKLKEDVKYFESPAQAAVKLIVPTGSQSFYDLAEKPGARTMHTYFVAPSWTMTCVFED